MYDGSLTLIKMSLKIIKLVLLHCNSKLNAVGRRCRSNLSPFGRDKMRVLDSIRRSCVDWRGESVSYE